MNASEYKVEPQWAVTLQVAQVRYAEALRQFGEAFRWRDWHGAWNRLCAAKDALWDAEERSKQ